MATTAHTAAGLDTRLAVALWRMGAVRLSFDDPFRLPHAM